MNWLVKEEPTHYGFDALVRDRRTRWSGVKNPLAQLHLRSMKNGERVLYYHTGNQKAVVAVARVASDPYPEPADKSGKLVAVDLVPVRRLPRPVTLAAIKGDRTLQRFPLVRVSRLSVMPVSDREWAAIDRLARVRSSA